MKDLQSEYQALFLILISKESGLYALQQSLNHALGLFPDIGSYLDYMVREGLIAFSESERKGRRYTLTGSGQKYLACFLQSSAGLERLSRESSNPELLDLFFQKAKGESNR